MWDFSAAHITWQVVNDTVMGGRSHSRVSVKNDRLFFSGTLITDGGGFASVRGNCVRKCPAEYDLLRLRVRGDGRTYKARLFIDTDRASYQHSFDTSPGTWLTIELPINRFEARIRGRPVHRPELRSSDIVGAGFILADGRDGPFELIIDWLELDRSAGEAVLQDAE